MRIAVNILTLLLVTPCLMAQEWDVPADRKGRLSPFEFTQQNRDAGQALYTPNCASCHGIPGRNNWLRDLKPEPGDPAGEKYQSNSDGEIYYKVSEGRGQMPGFKNVLSQTDIWNLVAYVRSYNPSYAQVVAPPRRSDAPDYSFIALNLEISEPAGTVKVKATGYLNEEPVPVPGAEVQLSAERYFGRLVLAEGALTDESGVATITIPATIKGDREGMLNIRAKLTEEDLYGIAATDTLLRLGEPVVPVSLTEKRAMWNTVRKAPVWLIITFTLSVLAVWGFIFRALLAVRDIWIIGKMDDEVTTQ